MLRFVKRHDLETLCTQRGLTLHDLALRTQVPEDTLRGFAAGEVPLSASDRFEILKTLILKDRIDLSELEVMLRKMEIEWCTALGIWPRSLYCGLDGLEALRREMEQELASLQEELRCRDQKVQ